MFLFCIQWRISITAVLNIRLLLQEVCFVSLLEVCPQCEDILYSAVM
jgi:hypothetical protein